MARRAVPVRIFLALGPIQAAFLKVQMT
jgi:hypothetical protein